MQSDRPNQKRQGAETFYIPAMDCPEEFQLIEAGLVSLAGVLRIEPDYVRSRLRVEFDPEQLDSDAVAQRLRRIGFPAEVASQGQASARGATGGRGARLHPATIAGGVALALAGVLYIVSGDTLALRVLAIVSTVLSGLPVARAALRALRLVRLDMNVLMSTAAAGALALAPATGEWLEAPTAMFLFGVALWLEQYSLGRARHAVETLVELTPTLAHRLSQGDGVDESAGDEGRDGDGAAPKVASQSHDAPLASTQLPYDDVAPEDIAVGDLLLVKPGERIPADGEVTDGRSFVNQSPVTGESAPVEKQPGDNVFAGSLNGEGMLHVRATKTSDASTLAHVARLVEQAQSARAPSERFIDQFARRYTPTIIALSLLVALGIPLASHFSLAGLTPMPREAWFDWIHRGLVLLVIACPCALVISTPITIVCGLHRATRYGVLVKGGQFLETAAVIDGVAIDKTGTLTVGSPRVTDIVPADGTSPDEVLRIAASLESHSEHPLGAAIVAAARQRGTQWPHAQDFRALRGEGVQGTIDGQTYYVASPRFFDQRLRARAPAELTRAADGAATVVLVGTEDRVIGAIHLADQPRSDAAQAIAELRDLGIRKVVMLTGDSAPVAGRIAHELGIDEFHGDLLPEEKVERVKALSDTCSNLAMVGDGVNDAPALAASRVGIALGSQSSDTALETADVVVLSPHVRRVPQLVRLARRTRHVLWQNVGLALGIKVAVFIPATLGLATMWMAVAADVGASLLVIANGMRLLSGGDQDSGK